MAIAAYYKQFMEQGVTRWKEPYVSVEQVAAVGDTCQLQMRKMGYSTFHKFVRYDSKNIRKSHSTKIGWYTYGWSRPLLTGNFVHACQNGWAHVNSPWLIEEMKQFEVHITKSGKEKLEHEEGAHDDRIFAAAMAIFCPHDMDILAQRSQKRLVEEIKTMPLDFTPYPGGGDGGTGGACNIVIPASALREKQVVTMDDLIYGDSRAGRFR
jgi:hypothetical protein